jgi:hypothetical protein
VFSHDIESEFDFIFDQESLAVFISVNFCEDALPDAVHEFSNKPESVPVSLSAGVLIFGGVIVNLSVAVCSDEYV